MISTPAPSPEKPRPAALVVVNPSGNRNRVDIDPLPFQIGRAQESHLVLRDNRISRSHARIVAENGEYFVEDLDSRHGVLVNGARIRRKKLRNADRVEFGLADSYQLIFTHEEGGLGRLAEQLAVPAGGAAGNLAKLRAIVEVARAVQSSLSVEDVLASVVDAALTITGAERGFLLLLRGDDLEVRTARSQKGEPLPASDLQVPTRLIHRALQQRRELLSMNFDPAGERAMQPERTVAALELRSVVCVPLVRVRSATTEETSVLSAAQDTVGVLYMDSRAGRADLSTGNRELLQTLALEASTILENARLLESERQHRHLEEELSIARSIQKSLLPKRLPDSGWFRAAGSSIPSHHVGGDYFDVRPLNPDCWEAVVADVSGKGVSSALLASLLQGVFLHARQGREETAEMMHRLNEFLLDRTGGEKYATIFFCTIDRFGHMFWVNAGHCAPILLRADGSFETLAPNSMPVGLLDIATYETDEAMLGPGDRLVIYSDGLSEALDPSGEYFDVSRIRAILASGRDSSCKELLGRLLQALEEFSAGAIQDDDVTCVILEYAPEQS